MKIGIIGASLAGLTAGKKLALAGHEVRVIEKSRTLGGRLATFESGGNLFDYGVSHFAVRDSEFRSFVDFLLEEGDIREWISRFEYFDGTQLHELNPNRMEEDRYVAPKGMAVIAQELSRWVDVTSGAKAGGLTYIGPDRTKKRSWMINLTDISVYECDAVVIAAPAPEAYGVLQTAQDETAARRIIRHIDEITYASSVTVMATYEQRERPDWYAIESADERVSWIINESSKRDNENTTLVLQSSDAYARGYRRRALDAERVAGDLLERASEIAGERWIRNPLSSDIHFWKYAECNNPMDEEYLELEMEGAPLALVGDYLGGNTVESAFLSGHRLAEAWIQKYEPAKV